MSRGIADLTGNYSTPFSTSLLPVGAAKRLVMRPDRQVHNQD